MRTVIGQLVMAVVLAVAGAVCWTLGSGARQVILAREQLATMQYADASVDSEDLSRWLRYAAPVPSLGAQMATDVREKQATADYWLARYDALAAIRAGTSESDPEILLLASNAAFRVTQKEIVDRPTAIQHLQDVAKSYADVLKVSPSDDAAYNYEVAVRARDSLELRRGATKSTIVDLTPTIHGVPGMPPKGPEMSQFKIMVPKNPEERDENQEAGKGGQKGRKG